MPSPDGNWFAYTDKDQQLWLYDFAAKQSKLIDVSETRNFRGLAWAADSKWLAYNVNAENGHAQVTLYRVEDSSITALTSDRVDSYPPGVPTVSGSIFFPIATFNPQLEVPGAQDSPNHFLIRLQKSTPSP